MSSIHSNISYLKQEIQRFLDKYYLNQAIRGLLLFLAMLFFSYLVFSSLSYFFEFNQVIRFIFLCLFIFSNLFVLVRWFCYPFLQSKALLKRKTDLEASYVIGQMFPEIADKLTNTLQLHEGANSVDGDKDLLAASIGQKTKQLKVFDFTEAIDIRLNRKYLKYTLPSFLTVLLLSLFIPVILTQGGYKMVRFDKEFLPFLFKLEAGNTTVEEGLDIPVRVSLVGERIPEKVYLVTDQGKFLMNRSLKNTFHFSLLKVKLSGSFYFEANGYESKSYKYRVTGKNILGKLSVLAQHPKYLNKKDVLIQNPGDITIPEGTTLTWKGNTINTQSVTLSFLQKVTRYSQQAFSFHHSVKNAGDLMLVMVNKFNNRIDSSKLHIAVIKDEYPNILLNEISDSIQEGVKYFTGQVSDDYGISSLRFTYSITRKGQNVKTVNLPVMFIPGTKSSYSFAVDFRRESVQLEDNIEYFFTVSDNDGVNGKKSTRSYMGQYSLPSLQELNQERELDQEKTARDIEKIMEQTKSFERAVEKLKKDFTNTKSKEWNNKQQIQQLKEEQQQLNNALERIKEELQQSTQDKNQLSEMDQEILEKQEMIQKLLDQVMDEELKKLLDEIEKMFNERADAELKKELDKLDQSSENMTKQLDRTLEMLKRLQVNERIDDLEKELKETAKMQEEVTKQVDEKSGNKEELLKKQQDIKDRFDAIQEKLDAIKKLNQELMDPLKLDDTQALEKSIDNQLDNAQKELNDNKKNKAKEAQQQAGDQMEQLADQLDRQQQASNQQQAEEDMEMLRQILESLMVLSFDQESLIEQFSRVKFSDPKYRKLGENNCALITKQQPYATVC